VVNELGFYAMWVMNISSKLQFAARYDFWDPVSDADTLALSDKARQKTYAGALNYFWDDNVRITAALDVLFFSHRKDMVPPLSSSYTKDWDTRNHTATLQVQYKF
jgi:TorA maturation chaperone TorD